MTIMIPFVRDPFNYDRDEASLESGLKCEDPSLTSQEFLEEQNLNYMLERFGVTGEIQLTAQKALESLQEAPIEPGDYRSMLHTLQAADEAFYALPAHVRREFNDDPANFCDFAVNPDNLSKLREWGLAPEQHSPSASLSDVVAALDRMAPKEP